MTGAAGFGVELVEAGLVTESDLEAALAESGPNRQKLEQTLVRRQLLTEVDLAWIHAQRAGVPLYDFSEFPVSSDVGRLLPREFERKRLVIPVSWDDDALSVAAAQPDNIELIDDVLRELRDIGIAIPVRFVCAVRSAIAHEIQRVWEDSDEGLVADPYPTPQTPAREAESAETVTQILLTADDVSHVRLVNSILHQAVELQASDVHLEPDSQGRLRVRARVDGLLRHIADIPEQNATGVIARLKVIAGLDISQKRLPQDGRFSHTTLEHTVDIRVVALPLASGTEAIVLRLLDRSTYALHLGDLGFAADTLAVLRQALRQPGGFVLVAGPTGSGKSTTINAALREELNSPARSVVTVEDPVEYKYDAAKQIQVNEQIGLTFASALRSILRADPDIVLVGEIRDVETATIAAQAALTGHVILSTVHANEAAAVPARLVDIGVEPHMVATALSCVLVQRLARRLCPDCKVTYRPDRETLDAIRWPPHWSQPGEGLVFSQANPKGCRGCRGEGHQGRTAIAEIMLISPALRQQIQHGATLDDLRNQARHEGMRPLRDDGLEKLANGSVSLEEFIAACG